MQVNPNQVVNNFETLVSYKIDTTSKGFNTTIHVYQGADIEIIKKVIENTIEGHFYGQKRLAEEVNKV